MSANGLVAKHGLRHPREGREFVHHPPQVADLAHDRTRELLEGRGIRGDLLAVTALEPLGGQLDRRQRVLDLVRDAARHVRPGGAALVEQLLGDVVEGQNMPALDPHPLHRQGARLARRRELDYVLALLAVEVAVEFGRQRRELLADRLLLAGPEQRLRGAVDQAHVRS
jgi:hypothetical protein